jgi:RpiR family glv operon transcriptional regulator
MILLSISEIYFILRGQFMRTEELINKYSDRLTENDMDALSIILKNKNIIGSLNSKEISDFVYTSPAGLTRLAKKLGFNGFTEFKYFLKNDVEHSKNITPNHMEILVNDMNDTLKLMEQTNLHPLVTAIHDANRVYVYGTGWGEKRAAELLARNFLAYNKPLFLIPSFTELLWVLDDITENDLLFIISFSGENKNLVKSLKKIRLKNVPYISITPLSNNTLSSSATYNLYYSNTNLNISDVPGTEYNYFSPLELVADALFRYYMDTYSK